MEKGPPGRVPLLSWSAGDVARPLCRSWWLCSLWASSTGRRPTRPGPPQGLGGATGDRKPWSRPPAVFRHPGAAELSLAGRGPGARCHGGPGPGISNGKPARRDGRGPLGGFLPSDRNVRAKGCTEARGPAREPPPGAPQQAAGCWATDGCARRPRGQRAPAQHRDRARVPPHVPAPGRAGTPEPRSQGRPSTR